MRWLIVLVVVSCAPPDERQLESVSYPEVAAVRAISSTDNNGCGLDLDGAPVCWGYDERDVLDVPDGSFAAITGGQDYACALDAAGAVTCWGNPTDYTQLASGLPGDPWGLLDLPGGEFTQIDGGDDHACGVRPSGLVRCWGRHDDGRTAEPDDVTFQSVSAGSSFSIGLDVDGQVHLWGDEPYGFEVSEGTWLQVDAGWDQACGIRDDTTIECWSLNYDSVPAPTTTGWAAIRVGFWHACALSERGEIACWGRESWGEISLRNGPSPEPGSQRFDALDAGEWTTCARTVAGEFMCWGNDYQGQSSPPRLTRAPG